MIEYYGHNDYRDYLAHHGILGMKWGKRNGPPYPLGVGDHSASEKKAGWRDSLKKDSKKKAQKKNYEDLRRIYAKNYNYKRPPKATSLLENSEVGKRYKEAIKAHLREEESLWNDEEKRNKIADELEKEEPSGGYYKNIEGSDAAYVVSQRLQRRYGDPKIEKNLIDAYQKWLENYESVVEDILGEWGENPVSRIRKNKWTKEKETVSTLAKNAIMPDWGYMYSRAIEEYENEKKK